MSEQLAALAASLADIQARKADLEGAEAQVKLAIRQAVDDQPGDYDAGPLKISVTVRAMLDLKAIEDKYPPDQRPELYETPDPIPHVTTKRVRANIVPVDLEPFVKPSAPIVSVK